MCMPLQLVMCDSTLKGVGERHLPQGWKPGGRAVQMVEQRSDALLRNNLQHAWQDMTCLASPS